MAKILSFDTSELLESSKNLAHWPCNLSALLVKQVFRAIEQTSYVFLVFLRLNRYVFEKKIFAQLKQKSFHLISFTQTLFGPLSLAMPIFLQACSLI